MILLIKGVTAGSHDSHRPPPSAPSSPKQMSKSVSEVEPGHMHFEESPQVIYKTVGMPD